MHGVTLCWLHPAIQHPFRKHVLEVVESIFALAKYIDEQPHAAGATEEPAPGLRRLMEQTRLMRSAAVEVRDTLRIFRKLPVTRNLLGREAPRIISVAQTYLGYYGV